jgi:indolepyruvate ferredoxin oxidoreductase beta subunit
MKTTNVVLLGIGGQGTLTMMEILALAAEAAGEEVRVLSRVSLARLGGSGMCHVRLGPSSSPTIPAGEADILVALEQSEALRALPLARRGALAFISVYRRQPIAAGVAGLHYPTQQEITHAMQEAGVSAFLIPESLQETSQSASELTATMEQAGDSRVNMLLLGVLAGYTRLLPRSNLEKAIAQRLPRFAEQNVRAFLNGWRYGESLAKTA